MPAVDSAVMLLKKKKVERNEKLEKFVEKLFSHKKNTLGAALKSREFENEKQLLEYAKEKGLDKKRVYSLTIEELLELSSLMVASPPHD